MLIFCKFFITPRVVGKLYGSLLNNTSWSGHWPVPMFGKSICRSINGIVRPPVASSPLSASSSYTFLVGCSWGDRAICSRGRTPLACSPLWWSTLFKNHLHDDPLLCALRHSWRGRCRKCKADVWSIASFQLGIGLWSPVVRVRNTHTVGSTRGGRATIEKKKKRFYFISRWYLAFRRLDQENNYLPSHLLTLISIEVVHLNIYSAFTKCSANLHTTVDA